MEEIPHTNETNKEDTPNHMFRNHQYQATSASRNANNRSRFKPPLSRVNRGKTGRMTKADKFKGQKNQWSNTPRDSNRHQNYMRESLPDTNIGNESWEPERERPNNRNFGNAASWEPEREKPDNRNFGNAANWEPDWGNFEPGLHRTQSDSFLPYSRPPNINQD